jgi:hypothetical protein
VTTTKNVPTLLIAIPETDQAQLEHTLFWRADMRRSFATPRDAFGVARTLSPDLIILADGAETRQTLEQLRREPVTHDTIVILLGATPDATTTGPDSASLVLLPPNFGEAGETAPWHKRLEQMLHLRQRRETRVLAEFPVHALLAQFGADARRVEATALNISSRGMLLDTPELLPRNSRAELTFELSGSGAPTPVAIVGEIVRTAETADGHKLAGIHFVVVRKDARLAVRDFLRAHRPADAVDSRG